MISFPIFVPILLALLTWETIGWGFDQEIGDTMLGRVKKASNFPNPINSFL